MMRLDPCIVQSWGPASLQVSRYGLEEKDFDFSAERVTASVHESLARLGLEYLDVVQAHDVEFGSLDQARGLSADQLSMCVRPSALSMHVHRAVAAGALLKGHRV